MPDDDGRLAAAVAELYAAAPETFTGRRGELAAAARADGDRAAAQAIAGLRRPTRAAWVVNALARTDPGAPPRLAELSAALSAAQQAGQAARLRELSAERWALVDALTGQALAAAGIADPPPALRTEVTETLTAALADPAVAADFAAGTLTRAAQWSGFGVLPAGGAGSTAGAVAGTGAKPRAVPPREAAAKAAEAGKQAAAPKQAARKQPKPTAAGSRREAQGRERETPAQLREAQARQQAEQARQRAAAARQAAAEQAARVREQREEAERALAAAAEAAAAAGAAEDQLEGEVRDLEQRLTQARGDLASARMRARRTEMAERRARQVLDRLPPA